MGSRMRWLTMPIALVALLVVGMPPTSADHATRNDVRNLEPLGEVEHTDTLANSDLAFWGDTAYQGTWEGFLIHDISDPANPQLVTRYADCDNVGAGLGGGQGDVIIWGDLLVRGWNAPATASAICGTDASGDPIPVPLGFEGIHIFDVSDPTDPQLVGEVNITAPHAPDGVSTGCGSHTLTAVPDPANNRLLVYVGGSSQACPGMELVDIPLNDPASAEWYGRAEAIPDGATAGRSCHDITVYMVDKLRAVCSGSWTETLDPGPPPVTEPHHGFAYFSMDEEHGGSLEQPVLLYQQDVPGTRTIGHTSAFSWDGKILLWSHEPGGGVQAACEITDPVIDRQMFFFAAEPGPNNENGTSLKGTWTIPTQTADESCASVHIMQSIPTLNGLDVMTSGTYMAGTYLVDYTDPITPKAIGWSDPPADVVPAPPGIILGGAWATYWYNGFLYESNIKKGLFVHRSTSPEAQTPARFDFLNPQTMMGFSVPGPTPMCRGQEATHVGTPGNDTIRGTPGPDVIVAFGGRDLIVGRGGNDLICAGGGRDRVSGGPGHDRIFGQGGNDLLRGNAGNDFLHGGPGRDVCNGGPGRDRGRSCEVTRNIP